jgi:hypothetical protein
MMHTLVHKLQVQVQQHVARQAEHAAAVSWQLQHAAGKQCLLRQSISSCSMQQASSACWAENYQLQHAAGKQCMLGQAFSSCSMQLANSACWGRHFNRSM